MKTTGKLDLWHLCEHWGLDSAIFTFKPEALERSFAAAIENDIRDPRDVPTDVIVTPTQVRLYAGFFCIPQVSVQKPFEIIWSHKEFIEANCLTRGDRDRFVATLQKLIAKAKKLKYQDWDNELKEGDELIS